MLAKYLGNIPRSKKHHICSMAVHTELVQMLLTATITERQRNVLHGVEVWGLSVPQRFSPKGCHTVKITQPEM